MSHPLDFTNSEPELYTGERTAGNYRLEAIALHETAALALRDLVSSFWAATSGLERRPYEANAELEQGEQVFEIEEAALSAAHSPRDQDGPREEAFLLAIDMIRTGLGRDEVLPPTLTHEDDAHPRRALFYAVRIAVNDDQYVFVKKRSPYTVLAPGSLAFLLADSLTVLRRQPNFILASDFDIVITLSTILIFSKSAFEQLVSDVRLNLAGTRRSAQRVAEELSTKLPISQAAQSALESACKARLSLSRRLAALPTRLASIDLTVDKFRSVMTAHGEEARELLNAGGEFDFDETSVAKFLDVLEGRWFEDDFSPEKRRADRLSKRS